jgi:porin
MLLPAGLSAQEGMSSQSRSALLSDSTQSGYSNQTDLGGPETVGAELEQGNAKSDYYFRIPIRVFKPWYDTKVRLNETYGLQYGINYTTVFLKASDGITNESETSAAGGIFDIPVSWTPIGRESGNTGTFALKLENRHSYTTAVPMFLGFDTGSILLPATKVNEFSFRFWEMYYQQTLQEARVRFAVGKVDPTNYWNFHALIHPFMNFFNYGFSVSPTANWPNAGFGALASWLPTKAQNWYVMAGLHDAGGDPLKDGEPFYIADNFFDGKFFSAVEVGFFPSFEERYFRKASITIWHSDAYEGSEEGQGVAIASNWFIDEKYIPFFLAGFSDGKGANTLAKNTMSGGMGYRFKSHDILGAGFNWADPTGGLTDQYTLEIYYRFYLTEHLAITPDIQLIKNPSLNPDQSWLSYFGIRGRITL